jgi:hypothetical protein
VIVATTSVFVNVLGLYSIVQDRANIGLENKEKSSNQLVSRENSFFIFLFFVKNKVSIFVYIIKKACQNKKVFSFCASFWLSKFCG